FVDAAGALAARRAVAGRCEFILADVRDPRALPAGPFDAAAMLRLDPVARAAPLRRPRVRRGGLYIIDDACRDPRHAGSWRWAHVPTRSEQEDFIASLGDRVVRVHVPTPSANRRLNERLYRSLATQARAVRLAHPDLAP